MLLRCFIFSLFIGVFLLSLARINSFNRCSVIRYKDITFFNYRLLGFFSGSYSFTVLSLDKPSYLDLF